MSSYTVEAARQAFERNHPLAAELFGLDVPDNEPAHLYGRHREAVVGMLDGASEKRQTVVTHSARTGGDVGARSRRGIGPYAELLTALELDPWFNDSRGDTASGNMRTRAFGTAGMLTYFVLEETREVVATCRDRGLPTRCVGLGSRRPGAVGAWRAPCCGRRREVFG